MKIIILIVLLIILNLTLFYTFLNILKIIIIQLIVCFVENFSLIFVDYDEDALEFIGGLSFFITRRLNF
jgi:hypothetical protein